MRNITVLLALSLSIHPTCILAYDMPEADPIQDQLRWKAMIQTESILNATFTNDIQEIYQTWDSLKTCIPPEVGVIVGGTAVAMLGASGLGLDSLRLSETETNQSVLSRYDRRSKVYHAFIAIGVLGIAYAFYLGNQPEIATTPEMVGYKQPNQDVSPQQKLDIVALAVLAEGGFPFENVSESDLDQINQFNVGQWLTQYKQKVKEFKSQQCL